MTILENMLQKKTLNNRTIVYFNDTEAFLAGVYPNVPHVIGDIQKLDGVNGDQSSLAAGNVDFSPAMAFLTKYTNNFFRHWVIFYPNFVDAGPEQQDYPNINKDPAHLCEEIHPSVTSAGQPWRERYCPFLYNKILGKWDLWRYNEEFFGKLHLMVKQAYDSRIIVQIMLFDRTGIDVPGVKDKCLRWHYSPWNAANNVNKVINNNDNGVGDFYNRSLMGEIRYRERGDRERWAPPGPPVPVVEPISLGELQDLYVQRVLQSTAEFPNVCYEIMNEPIRGDESGAVPARVKWANEIVGTIWSVTQGQRFIFYNDFSGGFRAGDVVKWKTLSNYSKLDGVIFHGDTRGFNPDATPPPLDAEVLKAKILQVSTDTRTNPAYDYNRATAENAFRHHMIFQAEETAETGAAGIHDAVPPPTILSLPNLCGTWIKTGENPASAAPRFFYTQRPDGSYLAFNPDGDHLSIVGRVGRFDSGRLWMWNETRQTLNKFASTLSNGNRALKLTRDDNWTQTFTKYEGPLTPFFYQWEKISENPVKSMPLFFLFFYPDGKMVTRRKSDLVVNNQGSVTLLAGNQIGIHSDVLNNDTVWNYKFSSDGNQLTLEKADHSWTQVFKRVV